MRHFFPLCFILASFSAQANDTTAELGTGGLVMTRSADIDMRSEDLFISESEVRVRYRFFNRSTADIVTRVAFPMPNLAYADQDSNITIPDAASDNFLDFSTRVNGTPVKLELEQKALAKGIDRTAYLRGLGLPLAFYKQAAGKALDGLAKDRWPEMVKLGLAEITEYGTTDVMQKHLEPRWTLQSAYHWQQVFPAGQEIVVEHTYKPSVGGSAGTSIGSKEWDRKEAATYKAKYCLDASVYSYIEEARKKTKSEYPELTENRIEYILKTGANWAGPIGDFRLVIDKGAADNIVSLCGDGWKKISASQFELRKSDFVPTEDFHMLILKPWKNN